MVSIAAVPVLAWAHAELDEQISAVSAEISRRPEDAELYLRRGELYREDLNWYAALLDYEEAAKRGPGLHQIGLARARLLLEAGRLISARGALDEYVAAHPDEAQGWLVRARLFLRLEQRAEAEENFARGVALLNEPRPEDYLEWADAAGSEQHAVEVVDTAIKKLGPLITLQLRALELERKLGRHEDALARLRTIVAHSPRKEQWLLRQGEALEALDRPTEARQAYQAGLHCIESLPPFHRETSATKTLRARLEAGLERTGN